MGLVATIHPRLPRLSARLLAHVRRHPWREAATIIVLSGIAFGVGFRLSLSTFLHNNLAVCWPLVGMQSAALLRISRRRWPAVLMGMLISQIILESSEPIDEIAVDTLSDVAEVLIAAFCLPGLKNLGDWIKQPRLFQRFMIGPMLLGPAITAFPVAAVFARELHLSFWGYWARWFFGDSLGIVLWLPLGIVLLSRETYALFHWKALPLTVGLIGTLSLAGWGMFHMKPLSISFTLLPLLLLIALKLGFSGSVIAVNILSVVSAEGTLHHLGPFGLIPEPHSVTTLQIFLAVAMLMCFPISIILLERDEFQREMKAAYKKMEQLAISDGLTGLANRRRFDSLYEEEWRRALRDQQPIAVIMIDVDCFKLFNDHYGHLAGDECLRRIADSIRCKVERAGDLAARFGGEEFVVLMPRTSLCGAFDVAEMVRSGVESLQLEHKRNPHRVVTISIGCCSVVPTAGHLPEALLEAADRSLYAAKRAGRNCVSTINMKELREPASQAS